MILVLVGTNPYSFDRLVRAMDNYAEQTGAEVFIQLGNTTYIPENCRFERFLPKEEILKKIRESSLVVTQGGFGSISDSLREGKPTLAVPRMPELNEATDKQEDIVRELEKLGMLLGVYDISQLHSLIDMTQQLNPKHICNNRIGRMISNFIQEHT